MPKIRVIVSEEMEVPEGTTIVLAPSGIVSILRLPDGTEIKPWLTYEKNPDADEPQDVCEEELYEMDVRIGGADLDYERDVQVVSGDVEKFTHEGVIVE